MDPFSIATSCVGLAAEATNLLMRISVFVSEVRNARNDMDAVMRELVSLQLCLGVLRDDEQQRHVAYPESMKHQINTILDNTELVFDEMRQLLSNLSTGRLGRRMQWASAEQGEMNRLRSSLESNKMTLEITLTMDTISLLAEQKRSMPRQTDHLATTMQQYNSVLAATDRLEERWDVRIEEGAAQVQAISHELTCLQGQLATLAQRKGTPQSWNTFISQSQTWTQSLVVPFASLKDVADNLNNINSRRCARGLSPTVAPTSSRNADNKANWAEAGSSHRSASIHDAGMISLDSSKRCPACLRCLTCKDELTAVETFMREISLSKENAEKNQQNELPTFKAGFNTSLPEAVGREPRVHKDDKIVVSDHYGHLLAEKDTFLARSQHEAYVTRDQYAQTYQGHTDAIPRKQSRYENVRADLDTYKHLLTPEEARLSEVRRRSASDLYSSTWGPSDEDRIGRGQSHAQIVELVGSEVRQNLQPQPRHTIERAETTSPGARTFEDMGVPSTKGEVTVGRRLLGRRSTRTSELSNPPKYSLPARIHERLGTASN